MKPFFVMLAVLALSGPAGAIECVNGVYRAGCVTQNGKTATVTKPPVNRTVHCAKGDTTAACVGPNGGAAAVHHSP
jgi:hypothetical protein